jgi:hypothetical protein
MKMRRKRRTEKLEISLSDFAMVFIRLFSWVHDLDSLKTLNKRKARNADMAPLLEDSSSIESL